MLDTMGDVRVWIRKGAGRSYRDLNGCLLLYRSCGLSYLHVIAGLVLFLGRVKWQIRSVSSVKSLLSKSVCTCYFLFRWLVNDRARQVSINHTFWAVNVTLIHSVSLRSCPGFQLHMQTHTHGYLNTLTSMHRWVLIYGCLGLQYWL